MGALLGLAVAGLVYVSGNLLLLVLIGAILAYLLFPLVNRLEARGMSRTLAASAVFFGLLALVVAALVVTVPLVLEQAETFQSRWAGGRFYVLLDQLEARIAERLPMIEPGDLALAETARARASLPSNRMLGYLSNALSVASDFIVVPFVLFFLLRDGVALHKRLMGFVPNRYFEFAMGVVYQIDAHLGGYLRGQSLVALFVGAFTALGLGVVGVDYYLFLGLLAGAANFVPYLGLFVSAGVTLAVSVLTTGGFAQVPGILIVFVVVQGLENAVLQPWITGRNVSLHPVTVLLAILLGGRLFGVVGMALAVPATAVAKVVVYETLVNLRRYHL